MLDFLHKLKTSKNLVIFVHGLQGSENTWLNASGKSFPSLLIQNEEIKKNFDFAYFNYYTNLFNIPETVKKYTGFFKGLLGKPHAKVDKNLHINEVSDLLSTYLGEMTHQYNSLILVCHSLGGLIAKSLIVHHSGDVAVKKIKLIFSLAVPHNGSHLADIGERILSNVQIKNLMPLNDDVNKINHLWISNKDFNPKIIYFQGKMDDIVVGASSVGFDANKPEIKFCDEDHISIAKPQSASALVCISVANALLGFVKSQTINELSNQEVADLSELEKQDFVLKLIIADVHSNLIANAKQRFYDAERVRRVLIQMDMNKEMDFLYSAIGQIYTDAFSEALAGKIKDGDDLLGHVHRRIGEENMNLLKSVSEITFLHKIGMVHQLANVNEDIWWAREHSIKTLEEYKAKKSE